MKIFHKTCFKEVQLPFGQAALGTGRAGSAAPRMFLTYLHPSLRAESAPYEKGISPSTKHSSQRATLLLVMWKSHLHTKREQYVLLLGSGLPLLISLWYTLACLCW